MPSIQAVALHATALPESQAPEWVHLLPAGSFSGVDGRGPYRVRDPQAVIKASLAAGKLPIDENHATDLAAPSGAASPAAGWIVAMEARPNGIWGRVEWTPSGASLITDRAYRGISPAMQYDKDGDVVRLLRAALTNNPNLPLTALHATGSVPPGSLSDSSRRQKAVLFIETAILMNKIPAGAREAFINLHMQDAEAIEHQVNGVTAPPAAPASGRTHAAPATAAALTPEQRTVCTTMGLDPEKFTAQLHHQARQVQAEGTLTKTDLMVCQNMGLSPVLFAEVRRAGTAHPDNHGLSDTDLMVARKMGLSMRLFAQTGDQLAAEQKRKLTGEPVPNVHGLSASEMTVCAHMNLPAAGLAAEKRRSDPDGLDLTEADRTVCRTMGISPQAMAAQKRNSGQGAPAIVRHAADMSPEQRLAPKQKIVPEIEAIMREYGLTMEDLNRTGISQAELISYKEAGLTRADIDECRRSRISPKALIYAHKMAREAPMWRAPPP